MPLHRHGVLPLQPPIERSHFRGSSESEELHEQGNERAEAVPGVLLQPSQIPDRPRVEAEQQSESRLA